MLESGAHTSDEVRRYGLQVAQPAEGYRFSLDALLLADFVRTGDNARIIDLGTGCGIIPMLLCRRFPGASVAGIDSNRDMAGLAKENVLQNGLAGRIDIICGDVSTVKSLFPVSSFDGVVANPPFRTPNSGRLSPKTGRDTARHESTAGMAEFLTAAKYLVKPSGRIWFIHHPDRLIEFISCAGEQKLAVLRLRMVHGSSTAPAKMFLAELAKARKGTTAILPPLIVHDDKGDYTPEVSQILSG
jgi:tRNA1Val (adenine37-N6)-methyltransferase